jgi:hypothetical protein
MVRFAMTNERLYDGRKIKDRLRGAGKRAEGLFDFLNMCGKNGWTFLKTGKLPKRHSEDREILSATELKLVEYLGLKSIDEILKSPEANRAA